MERDFLKQSIRRELDYYRDGLFNEDEGLPPLNPYGDAGTRESVICLPAPADWTTPRGLELFSPRFFGFDVDYMPFFR